MSQDTSVYGTYSLDPISADAFLQLPQSPYASTDPDLLSFVEGLPPYEMEGPILTQDNMFPPQDAYNFNPDPFSLNLEQELLWRQFEDPPFLDAEFNFSSTPIYPIDSYSQENPSQTSNTASSQNSLSPDLSPASTSESQGDVLTGKKVGDKRRNIGQNEYSVGKSAQVLRRKRARGDLNSQPVATSPKYVDRGYESMSPLTTIPSPQSDLDSANRQKAPEVVENVARAIDGMIDKFSKSQVKLTKEEIEALQTAGLPIPTTLPLTKVEQHALRDVRRKLKNKQAAMENRRRKKEYVTDLEKKLVDYEKMVSSLEERMTHVEREKQVLESELKRLKRAGKREKENRPVSAQTGACLMVFILCFGLVFGTWLTRFGPLDGHSLTPKNPNTPLHASFVSRTLKGDEDISQHTALTWLTDLVLQTGADLLSLFNFTSESTYFLINEESLLCQNHSCAPQ